MAGCVTSCSSDEVITNDMHYWSGPCWMGSSRGLGCIKRYQPYMFIGARRYDIGQAAGEHGVVTPRLPFLSQECRALAAPRPFLSIQEDPHLADAVRPAYELYRKGRNIAAIAHRWKTNLPVNVQEYMLEFLLERLCDIKPGQAPKSIVEAIRVELKSADPARQLRAARLACWWRPVAVAAELQGLIGSDNVAVRRAAAKALGRIGRMDLSLKHLGHPDPVVRLAVVEAMQLHGTPEAFELLSQNASDPDRWVREAKFQTLQVNPEE